MSPVFTRTFPVAAPLREESSMDQKDDFPPLLLPLPLR